MALGSGKESRESPWPSCPQPWPLGADPQSRDARQQRFAHFTELAIISVQEIVDFAKQVPGFLQLGREDQIALLKASTIEVTASPPILIKALPASARGNHRDEPQDGGWAQRDEQGSASPHLRRGSHPTGACQNTKQENQSFPGAKERKEMG